MNEIPIRTQQLIINYYLSKPFLKTAEIAFKLGVELGACEELLEDYKINGGFVIYHSKMNLKNYEATRKSDLLHP